MAGETEHDIDEEDLIRLQYAYIFQDIYFIAPYLFKLISNTIELDNYCKINSLPTPSMPLGAPVALSLPPPMIKRQQGILVASAELQARRTKTKHLARGFLIWRWRGVIVCSFLSVPYQIFLRGEGGLFLVYGC